MEFFPPNKRSAEYFRSVFEERGMLEIVQFHNLQAHAETKKQLQKDLDRMIRDEETPKQLIAYIKQIKTADGLEDKDVVPTVSIQPIEVTFTPLNRTDFHIHSNSRIYE
jgi:hypothetical protein